MKKNTEIYLWVEPLVINHQKNKNTMNEKTEEIKKEIKDAVENYQCPGCTIGRNIGCYKKSEDENQIECARHSAGTFMARIGRIYLGMPIGFIRYGNI